MGRFRLQVVTVFVMLLLMGCQSSHEIDNKELEEYQVEHNIDEVTEDDFKFRLVSEQKTYDKGEEVILFAELTYVGAKDEVVIEHSSSMFLFPMVEKIRNFDVSSGVDDIGLETVFKRNEPYKERYNKNGVGYAEENSKAYITFIEEFMKRDAFPSGHYVVNGETDFHMNGKSVNMKAEIDFKVVE